MSNRPVEISGKLLARNTLLNLIGQVVPIVVGVVTIPFIVRGLGTERFGILSLAWVVVSYSEVFDLGLGRAATKFVAEALGRDEREKVGSIVAAAVTTQALIGTVGGVCLVLAAPFFVGLLRIPAEFTAEATWTFRVMGLAVPLVLVSGSFSGALQGAQRFDLVNAVRVPAYAGFFLSALVAVALGLSLQWIVALAVLVRLSALLAYWVLYTRCLGRLRPFGTDLLRSLLSFGGWVTISSVVAPVLFYLERFLLGSLVSMSAVAYYTASYEVVIRALWILPSAVSATLLPGFSILVAQGDRRALEKAFASGLKFLLLGVGSTAAAVFVFADVILRLWLGAEYAENGTWAMRILSLGVLVNSLAWVPSSALHGAGRPDLTAKFHILEVPFYAGVAWALVFASGVTGAAVAWSLRVALDAALLFWAAFRIHGLDFGTVGESGLPKAILGVGAWSAGLFVARVLGEDMVLLILTVLPVALVFLAFTWKEVLDEADRLRLLKLIGRW